MKQVLHAMDVHCEGEPGRVIFNAHLLVEGDSISERLEYARQNLDWLRRMVLKEPRGYPGLCAVLVLPPADPAADFGIIVMTQSGFSPMSGTNSICAITALIETGTIQQVEPETHVVIETAVGLVSAVAEVRDGKVLTVTVRNAPSYVHSIGYELDVPEIGVVKADLAFSGQFVLQVDAASLRVALESIDAKNIIRAGSLVKIASQEQLDIQHPSLPALNYVGLVMIYSRSSDPGVDLRSTAVITGGQLNPAKPETWNATLDRSACGNATCARMTVLHAMGRMTVGETLVTQGLLGTHFKGSIFDTFNDGDRHGIHPTITGRAWVTSSSSIILDADDPFPTGYTLGDIWAR